MKPRVTYLILFLSLALFLSLSSPSSAGEKLTHVVKRGDTLWWICERYYGDPYLWPELWEMNKFITNPHWLHPGDVITLLEYEEIKRKRAERAKKVVEVKKRPLTKLMGIDVSSLTNIRALGFLRQERIEPWGRIFDAKAKRIQLAKGDTVYVRMYKEHIKPGDLFTVYNILNPVNHPLTGEELGYIHSFKGILEIDKPQEGYYVARIDESFRAISRDDLLIPYEPVSSCIFPVPCPDTLTAHIVASKDKLRILGQYSVVYIDAGHNMGVRRGQIFEAIEEREFVPDPQSEETAALPPTILGKIIILETREDTANGVVFWVSREFASGLKIRALTWHEDKQPRELAMLPACPIE